MRRANGAGSGSVSRVAMVSMGGGVVGGRARVAHGAALLVGGVGRPHHRELGLAGPGAAIGLLALTPLDFALAHGHAGAVETEVERRGIARFGVDDVAFVVGDLASECLGMALDRLGRDGEAGQLT